MSDTQIAIKKIREASALLSDAADLLIGSEFSSACSDTAEELWEMSNDISDDESDDDEGESHP